MQEVKPITPNTLLPPPPPKHIVHVLNTSEMKIHKTVNTMCAQKELQRYTNQIREQKHFFPRNGKIQKRKKKKK